ncbi:acylglycerol kinase, mitochondrial-like [Oscarella lobularis]|uniref:acylglycerol kinase, mitochondrial-like n=1 Tax=Oscarella lobularis TaxID=121494 RepID=UPI00331357F9
MEISNRLRVLRKRWKLTLFSTVLSCWSIQFGVKKFRENLTRREASRKAELLGNAHISSPNARMRKLTVFLNTRIKGGRRKYERDVHPILSLGGIDVNVVEVKSKDEVKFLCHYIPVDSDGVVVAGSEGDLSKAVNHMVKQNRQIPIGFVPLVKDACPIMPKLGFSTKNSVRLLCEASLAVVRGHATPVDLMKIESSSGDCVYAFSSFEWGRLRVIRETAKRLWWMGKAGLLWATIRSNLPVSSAALKFESAGASTIDKVDCGLSVHLDSKLCPSSILMIVWKDEHSNKFRLIMDWLMKAQGWTESAIFSKREQSVAKVSFKINADKNYSWFAIDGEHFDGKDVELSRCEGKVRFFLPLAT